MRMANGVVLILALVIGVVAANSALGTSSAANASDTHHLPDYLVEQRQDHLERIKQVNVSNPRLWTFVWQDDGQTIISDQVKGFNQRLASSLVYTWTTRLAPQYFRNGDYMPLYLLKSDGSEVRVAFSHGDGSLVVLVLIPQDDHPTGPWKSIRWDANVTEIQ